MLDFFYFMCYNISEKYIIKTSTKVKNQHKHNY